MGTPASATSPTAAPPTPSVSFALSPEIAGLRAPSAFGHPAAVPSPLATSPPVSSSLAMSEDGYEGPATPALGGGAPKIKLTLGRRAG